MDAQEPNRWRMQCSIGHPHYIGDNGHGLCEFRYEDGHTCGRLPDMAHYVALLEADVERLEREAAAAPAMKEALEALVPIAETWTNRLDKLSDVMVIWDGHQMLYTAGQLRQAQAALAAARGAKVEALEKMHAFLQRWCAGHNVRGEDGPCDCEACRYLAGIDAAARQGAKEQHSDRCQYQPAMKRWWCAPECPQLKEARDASA